MGEEKIQRNNRNQMPRRGPMGRGGPVGGAPVVKAKNARKTVKRLLEYIKEYKFKFMFIVIALILATTVTVLSPKIMGMATTAIFDGIKSKFMGTGGIDFAKVGKIVLTVLGLQFLSAFFNYVSNYTMATVASKIIYRLRTDVNNKFSKLPLKYFDKTTKGDVLSRMTNDIDNINATLMQTLTQIISSVFQVIGIIIMMFTISPVLAGISLLIYPYL